MLEHQQPVPQAPGKILDRKIVAIDDETQTSLEWHLSINEDGHKIWKPFQVDLKTGTIISGKPLAWAPLPGSQFIFLSCPIFEGLYEGTRGPGKRILDTELILTDSGWKQAGEVTQQDHLVAPDGTYTEIKSIHKQSRGSIYRVKFDDNATLDVDGDHLWSVSSAKNGSRDGWLVKSTSELIELLKQSDGKTGSAKNSWYIPTMGAPAPGKQWSGPDPYILGQLLGDGTMLSARITFYTTDQYKYDSGACHRLVCPDSERHQWRNILGKHKGADKTIPNDLLNADPETRLALLQGLMDYDGSIDEQGRCRFVSLSTDLAHGVQYLVRSLGGKASCYWEDRPSPKGGVDGRWRVNVIHGNKFNPFRLPRKANRVKPMNGVNRRIESIVQIADGPATCFAVAHPSHLFVAQDFIVTHNTITLLLDFAREVGKGFGNAWRGILFRKTFGDLDDVVKKIEAEFPKIFPGFKFLKSKSEYRAEWPTGEALLLRHMEDENDYPQYHGHEYPWIGWEELTQWENDNAYRIMFSCCRSTFPGIPKRIRATTNPYGPGHNWVKKRFELPHMRGKVIRNPGEVPRVAIHGTLSENFIMLTDQPEYPQIIIQSATNAAQGKAWLHGDWNVSAGGMIDDVWNTDTNVIPAFDAKHIPRGWTITRAYDHGQSHPFAVGWWLESNGEAARIPNGKGGFMWIGQVRGDLILYGEWYGCSGKPNEGLRMSATDVAQGILDREEDMGIRHRCRPGPADTEIWSKDSRGTGLAPADDMDRVYDPPNGMKPMWYRADKTPGSRVRGWQMLRSGVKDAIGEKDGTRTKKCIKVCDNCVKWLELVPIMPRDPKNMDDVSEKYEDHLGDMTRYRLNWEIPSIAVQHGTF